MMTAAKLEKFLCQFDWTEPAYPGLAAKLSIATKLNIGEIKNLICAKGTYTPNNDYLYLAQNGIPPEKSPNFMILICSGHLNLTVASSVSYMVLSLPIFKLWHMLMPTNTTYGITGAYIEGRLNAPMVMPQGVPIDYLFIAGQAEIT